MCFALKIWKYKITGINASQSVHTHSVRPIIPLKRNTNKSNKKKQACYPTCMEKVPQKIHKHTIAASYDSAINKPSTSVVFWFCNAARQIALWEVLPIYARVSYHQRSCWPMWSNCYYEDLLAILCLTVNFWTLSFE